MPFSMCQSYQFIFLQPDASKISVPLCSQLMFAHPQRAFGFFFPFFFNFWNPAMVIDGDKWEQVMVCWERLPFISLVIGKNWSISDEIMNWRCIVIVETFPFGKISPFVSLWIRNQWYEGWNWCHLSEP